MQCGLGTACEAASIEYERQEVEKTLAEQRAQVAQLQRMVAHCARDSQLEPPAPRFRATSAGAMRCAMPYAHEQPQPDHGETPPGPVGLAQFAAASDSHAILEGMAGCGGQVPRQLPMTRTPLRQPFSHIDEASSPAAPPALAHAEQHAQVQQQQHLEKQQHVHVHVDDIVPPPRARGLPQNVRNCADWGASLPTYTQAAGHALVPAAISATSNVIPPKLTSADVGAPSTQPFGGSVSSERAMSRPGTYSSIGIADEDGAAALASAQTRSSVKPLPSYMLEAAEGGKARWRAAPSMPKSVADT